jgi:hypothetical protein
LNLSKLKILQLCAYPASTESFRLRDTIVSFRLTAKEIESVKGLLRDLGLSRQLSKGRACRILFLALLSGYRPATCVGE